MVYILINGLLKTYTFPKKRVHYIKAINKFIDCLCVQNPTIKEQLIEEKNKHYKNTNDLIVGCIYVIAKNSWGVNPKPVEMKLAILNSVQRVNYILEKMDILNNCVLEESTSEIINRK